LKGKEECISIQGFVSLSLPRRNSAVSACSAVQFYSSSLEGAETLMISQATKNG
jgi:hypothetical protein